MTKLVTVAVVLLLGAAMVMSYLHGKEKRGGRKSGAQSEQGDAAKTKAEGRALDRLHEELAGTQFKGRLLAAKALVAKGDDTSIPFLINAMADDSVAHKKVNSSGGNGMNTVRFWCNEALKRISGRDYNFVWDDDGEIRDIAIVRWRKWYLAKTRADSSMAQLSPSRAPVVVK